MSGHVGLLCMWIQTCGLSEPCSPRLPLACGLQLLDPQLHAWLEEQGDGASHYFFAFRWVSRPPTHPSAYACGAVAVGMGRLSRLGSMGRLIRPPL